MLACCIWGGLQQWCRKGGVNTSRLEWVHHKNGAHQHIHPRESQQAFASQMLWDLPMNLHHAWLRPFSNCSFCTGSRQVSLHKSYLTVECPFPTALWPLAVYPVGFQSQKCGEFVSRAGPKDWNAWCGLNLLVLGKVPYLWDLSQWWGTLLGVGFLARPLSLLLLHILM